MKTNIQKYRKLKRIKQSDLAKLLNIPISTYRSYEYEIVEPPLRILLKLSDVYKISIDELVNNPIKANAEIKLLKIRSILD